MIYLVRQSIYLKRTKFNKEDNDCVTFECIFRKLNDAKNAILTINLNVRLPIYRIFSYILHAMVNMTNFDMLLKTRSISI